MNKNWNTAKKTEVQKELFALAALFSNKEADPERYIAPERLRHVFNDEDVPDTLRDSLYIVWVSSRCANRELVTLTLHLLANTIQF